MKQIDLQQLDQKAIGDRALTFKTHHVEFSIDPRIFRISVIERAVATLGEQIRDIDLEEHSDSQWLLRMKIFSELNPAEIEELFYAKLICVSVIQQSLEQTQDIQQYFLQSAHYVLTATQEAVGRQKLIPASDLAFSANTSEIAPGFSVRMGFGSAQLLIDTGHYLLPEVIETVRRLKSQCRCYINARQANPIVVNVESLLKAEIQGQGLTNRTDFMLTLVRHFHKALNAVRQETR